MTSGGFELYVAARYLKSKRRQAVVSVITVLSILGVAAGVASLIIALAVNNGFRNSLQRSLLGATPHVLVLEKEPSEGIPKWREIAAKLKTLPHVVDAQPALYGQVFLTSPGRSASATLKGALPGADAPASGIRLGAKLAQSIGLKTGDVVSLINPQGEPTPFGPRPITIRFRVAGLFESGFYDIDNTYAFTSLETAQKIFSTGDVVSAIELKLDDVETAADVARQAEALVAPKLAATNWMEQNRQLLGALRLEKAVSLLTVGIIQMVASLNILIALVMGVMEKKREIAILLSLGARRSQIRRIFQYQGLIIGGIGVVLGLVFGYTVSLLAGRYHWIQLDEAIYSLSSVPFEPRWSDALWVSAAALAVSFLATLYPARSATRIPPIETLRYE